MNDEYVSPVHVLSLLTALVASDTTAAYAGAAGRIRVPIPGLRGDFLFSFQPVPGTVFFAGYGGAFRDAGRFRFTELSRTSDGFFLKASYLIRR
ncbi:MAG: hypothetical protein ACRENB_13960 [Gemmatimonadales bacterium]